MSYRLSWAMRGVDGPGVIATVAAGMSFALGVLYMRASRDPSPFFAYWCSGVVTAALIGADLPGVGQARWSELELSLPVAPRERARARLLLSFGFWLLPVVATLALAQLGAFGDGQRLPMVTLLRSFSSAFTSVLLAVALRHTLGLGLAGIAAGVLRVGMIAVIALGFAQPSPVVTTTMLALAAPLLATAHGAATREPELRLPRATTRSARAAQSTSFDRVALRYVLGSGYAVALLSVTLVWVLAIHSGWLPPQLTSGLFILLWVVYHAAYSARLLRLGHLPVARERLFRFVAWPALATLALGVGLSLVVPSPNQHVSDEGGVTLRACLGSGAVLLVLGLLALHVVIRPGPALDARAWRRRPLAWIVAGLFLFGGLYQMMSIRWERATDPLTLALAEVGRALAAHLVIVLPIAVVLAVLLYRNLLKRFAHMEAPPRAHGLDDWFVQI